MYQRESYSLSLSREREKEGGRERGREREKDREKERERERERERESGTWYLIPLCTSTVYASCCKKPLRAALKVLFSYVCGSCLRFRDQSSCRCWNDALVYMYVNRDKRTCVPYYRSFRSTYFRKKRENLENSSNPSNPAGFDQGGADAHCRIARVCRCPTARSYLQILHQIYLVWYVRTIVVYM